MMRRIGALAVALAACACLWHPVPARGDDYIDRANALLGRVPDAQRSDLIILPLAAKMDPYPKYIQERVGDDFLTRAESAQISVVTPDSAEWPDIEKWLTAPAQVAVLEALARVTEDENPETRMVFALGYGVEAAPLELVRAESYIDLGDPPLLASSRPLYMKHVSATAFLALLDAARLERSDPNAALERLADLLFFGRQIADREMRREKVMGFSMMIMSFEKMRDVAYTDARSGSPKLSVDELTGLVRRLDERAGVLATERIRIPAADRIAAEQLLEKIYGPDGKIDRAQFVPIMSRMTKGSHPLRLFAETARWDLNAGDEPDARVARAALQRAFADLERRWRLHPFDPVLRLPTDFQLAVIGQRISSLAITLPDPAALITLRQLLRASAGGTRMALAAHAFVVANGNLPNSLSALRPNFTPTIDKDPFSERGRDLEFFLVRDQPAMRDPQRPGYEISIFLQRPLRSFKSVIGRDQYVIYSAGADDDRGFARNVIPLSATEASEGDHLFWPPVLSLYRQHLKDSGAWR